REVIGALVGQHVLRGDVVHVPTHPGDEGLPRPYPLVLVTGLQEATEVLERELRIDRNEPVAQPHDRVHALAAPEGVLEGEVSRREDLGEEVTEEQLAEPAPELRSAQDVVEGGDIPADLVDLAGRLAQLAEPLLHLAHGARGIVQPLADGELAALDEVEAFPETLV